MSKYLYNSGLPFSEKLQENIVNLDNRVKVNLASMILIDGGIGQGKTTLGVHVADQFNRLHGFPGVDLREQDQIGTGGKDFLQKMRLCFDKKLPCIVYDEAGDFNKRGSLTRFNAMINRTFETFRAFKITVIMCLPSFDVLDQSLFDKQIPRLLLHLRDRNESWGNFYGYGLYRMLLLRSRMKRLNIKNYAYTLINSNFRGHFKDLPPERCRQLDKFSTREKMSILRKSEIEIEGLVGYNDISRKVVRSVDWCRRMINKLKIRPKRVIQRAKYFDRSVIDILADKIDEDLTEK